MDNLEIEAQNYKKNGTNAIIIMTKKLPETLPASVSTQWQLKKLSPGFTRRTVTDNICGICFFKKPYVILPDTRS